MPSYVIKKGVQYLHISDNNDMQFKDRKQDANVFEQDEANIVLDVLRDSNVTGTFKARIKDKYVKKEQSLPFIAEKIKGFRRKGAKKRLEKGVQK